MDKSETEGYGNFLPEGSSRTLAQAEEWVFQKRLGLQVLGLGAPKLRFDSAERSGVLEMPDLHFQNRKFPPEAWVYVSDDRIF